MEIISVSLIVFAITLIWTKSNILGDKREFVTKRYESSKVAGGKPRFVHKIWHVWWFSILLKHNEC